MSRIPAGVIGAAGMVHETLSRAGFRFCFIGGLALQRWGEQRYTRDVDLTLFCEFGDEIRVAKRLAELLALRIPNAVEFAAESRVFLAQSSDGTPVDIAFGAIDFELRCLERASAFDFGAAVHIPTCSAEDLVVMKAFAGRSQDWPDIEGVVLRRGSLLDWALIERELEPLLALKEPQGTLERLAALRRRLRPG